MRSTHHQVAPEHSKMFYRNITFLTYVHALRRMGAPMRRRTGRKIKIPRTQATFESTFICMNANMIDEIVIGHKLQRTVWAWKFSYLQMPFQVFRKSLIAIKCERTLWTTVLSQIGVRIAMSIKIQFAHVGGFALVALEMPATRTINSDLLGVHILSTWTYGRLTRMIVLNLNWGLIVNAKSFLTLKRIHSDAIDTWY